jgi:hypothetical protein
VKRPWWIAALLGACSLYTPDAGDSAGSLPDPREAENVRFDSLVDAYLAGYRATYPVRATRQGVHDFDARFGVLSRAAFDLRAGHLRGYLERLLRVDPAALRPERRRDARLLRHRLEAEILELEGLRRWQRDPTFYTGLLRDGLLPLALVPTGPPDRRLARIIDRLEQVRDVVFAARENLEGFPRIRAEAALDDLSELRDFVRAGLPALFPRELDPSVRPRFERAQKGALQAFDELADRISTALSEAGPGSFAWGEDLLRARLLHEEMIEEPLDDLLRVLESEIPRARQERRDAVEKSDRAPDVARRVEDLRRRSDEIVPVPPDDPGLVSVEPPWNRPMAPPLDLFAPGPFEGDRFRSTLLAALPGSPGAAEAVSVLHFLARETYPGRHVYSLYLSAGPSKLRAAFPSRALADGWAHEAARHAAGAPDLLELCRGVAALRMHARGMTLAEAAAFLAREAALPPAVAEREARRAALDPEIFLGIWASLQIRSLRNDVAARSELSRREFHRVLLSQGGAPLPLLREILLGGAPP